LKLVHDTAVHTHERNSSAVPSSAAIDVSITSRCDEAPTAWTSNGEPPPESAFDSWALGGAGRAASVEDAGACTAPVGDTPAIEVGLGSVTSACDEVADDRVDCVCEFEAEVVVEVEVELVTEVASEYAGGGTELVAVLVVAACVLVCACVLEETVTTSIPGQREAMPMPN
jgi:hypothetical protein